MSETGTKVKRCEFEDCRCKLKLTDYACRCGKTFCTKHRVAESHSCGFDYKAFQKDQLLKTMSTPIVAEKVTMI